MKFKEEVKEIREMINAVDSHKAYNDDMIEYSTVQPIYSGLKFDVYVDTGLAYIHNNHEPVVFVRDGSERKNPLIPITVSLSPKVVGGVVPKNLKQEDVDSIFKFIVQNYEALILLAEDKLSITKFIDEITRVHKIVAESIEEMGQVKDDETGLQMSVWLDEGTNPKHNLRVKFYANNEQRIKNQFTEMSVEPEPKLFNLPKKIEIPKEYIEQLKAYVQNNIGLLYLLWKAYISLRGDFLPNATRVDKNTMLPVIMRQGIIEMGLPMNGYKIVVDVNNKFNFKNTTNGAYITNQWYDRIDKVFIPPQKGRMARVVINDVNYFVNTNQTLTQIQQRKK